MKTLAWVHVDDLSRSLDGVTYLEVADRRRGSPGPSRGLRTPSRVGGQKTPGETR